MKINIRHMLVIALGINRNAWEEIDNIYFQNEEIYHNIYLESSFRDDLLKRIFTMKTEEMINKVIGIVEYSYDKGNFLLIERIIRKIQPSIVNYVKNAHHVDVAKFYIQYGLIEKNEDEIFSIIACLVFLSYHYKKALGDNGTIELIEGKWREFGSTIATGIYNKNVNGVKGEEKIDELVEHLNLYNLKEEKVIKEEALSCYDLFIYNKDEKIDCSLETFISEDIEQKTYNDLGFTEDYKKCVDKLRLTDLEKYSDCRSSQFQKGVNRYVGCLSRFIRSFGLDSSDIFIDTPINNEILEAIFVDFYRGVHYNNIPIESKELYVASCIYLYNLIYLYKDSKEFYLNKEAEDKYIELKRLERELSEEQTKIMALKKEQKSIINEKDAEIKELKRKLKELEKDNAKKETEIIKLKDENTSLQETKKELNSKVQLLNDLIIERDREEVTNESEEEKLSLINKYKIGIFGGRNNIKALSEDLTNVYFYDNQNQDISSLNNLDIVFINTDFISHAFTNKIKSVTNKYQVPMKYLAGTNNDLMIDVIYKELNKLKQAN